MSVYSVLFSHGKAVYEGQAQNKFTINVFWVRFLLTTNLTHFL